MFWVAVVSLPQVSFVLVRKHSPQRWEVVLLRAGMSQSECRCQAVFPQSISIKRVPQKIGPPCVTIYETIETSPSCLSCTSHPGGDGSPKQIMVGRQHNHKQTKMWFDMTVQLCFLSSVARLHAMCHNKTFFSIILRAVVLCSTLSRCHPPCFPWLSLIMS